jgi:acyl-CoA synthetase (AMP-forming)/AMP-acid ligase II
MVQQMLREETLFDLSKGPLIRTALLRLSQDQHLLMIAMPRIMCDDRSNGLLLRELTALYAAYAGLTAVATGWTSLYGSAESGMIAAAYQPPLDANSLARLSVVLGNAVPGLAITLRDRHHLQEVPAGIPGEICVAGAGLAQAYLADAATSDARFVTSTAGVRLFRTGELGRYQPDSGIEYLGSAEQYLKHRGHIFCSATSKRRWGVIRRSRIWRSCLRSYAYPI